MNTMYMYVCVRVLQSVRCGTISLFGSMLPSSRTLMKCIDEHVCVVVGVMLFTCITSYYRQVTAVNVIFITNVQLRPENKVNIYIYIIYRLMRLIISYSASITYSVNSMRHKENGQ